MDLTFGALPKYRRRGLGVVERSTNAMPLLSADISQAFYEQDANRGEDRRHICWLVIIHREGLHTITSVFQGLVSATLDGISHGAGGFPHHLAEMTPVFENLMEG